MQLKRALAGAALGALFVGSTLAAALTLGDFPKPFVQNGQVQGLIVVGANAQPADVVAAIDLAARLGSDATVTKTISTPSVSSADVTGGIWLQKKGKLLTVSENLQGGGYTTLTSRYLPKMLEDGKVKEKDGTEVDYVQKLDVTSGATVKYDDASGDFTAPKLYIDMPQGTSVLRYELDFLGTFNASNKASNAKIELLGKQFTLGPSTASTMTLFGGGNELSLQAGGDAVTVSVGGESHTFKMISWTVDGNGAVTGATIEIDGNSDTYDTGSYYTIPGSTQKFYLDSVTVEKTPSTSGGAGETARAKLFVGSNKIEIPVSTTETPGTIKVNDETFRDAKGVVVKDSSGKYQKIVVQWAMNDNTRVLEGDKWTDPLFGAVVIENDGLAVPYKDSSRDVIELSKASSTSATLKFKNTYGTEYDLKLDDLDGSTAATWKIGSKSVHYKTTFAGNATTDAVPINDYVLLSKSTASTEGTSYLLELSDVDSDKHTVTFVDATTGKEYKANYDAANVVNIASGKYNVSSVSSWATLTLGDDFHFVVANNSGTYGVIFLNDGSSYDYTDKAYEAHAYTKGGTSIDLDVALSSGTYTVQATKTLNPSVDGLTSETYKLEVTTSSSEIDNVKAVVGTNDGYKVGDTNEYKWVSQFGTYAEYDTDADQATLYVPTDAVEVRVALGSPDMKVTTTSSEGGTITYKEAQPVKVAIAKLDSEVTDADKQNKDMILVGGTTVNSLVRELADNSKLDEAWDANASAWKLTSGEAIIKLVDDAFAQGKVALVVAGTDAADTAAAMHVLQKYDDNADKLSGKSVVKVVNGVVQELA